MNHPIFRAVRVLGPNDIRLIWRDGFFLTFIIFILPVMGLVLRLIMPEVRELVSEWVELKDFYGLILASGLIASEPILLGFVIGILFVEERDEGTLLALQASPLSLRSFLAYRILSAMILNVVLTVIGIKLAGLVSVSWLELMVAASLASLGVPITVFVYAIYMRNKVQALMLLKPVQAWGALPVLLFFVPTPWQWIGSIFLPLYYPMRLFTGAANGNVEWWLVLPGVFIPGIAIYWLFRRFERSTLMS